MYLCVAIIFCLSPKLSYSQDDDCHLVDACDEIDWMVEFDFQNILDADVGTEICIPLIVNNFLEIISFQFTITFDPNIIQFTQKLDPSNLPSFDPVTSCNLTDVANGNIGIIYFNQNLNGVCLPDGTEIVSFCFNVIGDPGESSTITITDNVVAIEVAASITDENPNEGVICTLDDFITNVGFYTVGCNSLTINGSQCSTPNGTTDGSISFSMCGGTAPYDWTMNAESGSAAEGEIVSIGDLSTGIYTVNVTDASGSMEVINIQVLNAPPLEVFLSSVNPTCVGREDGEVIIDQINGIGEPYFEAWSNFEFNQNSIDDLGPGEYSVTVTDGFGCRVVATETLEIDTLKTDANLLSGTSCPGGSDGFVELIASGGTPGGTGGNDYKFITPQGTFAGTSPFNSMASEGWYYFQVEDYAIPNCLSPIDSIFVPAEANLTMVIETMPTSCYGSCDGFVRVTPSGGSDKYQFALFDDQSNLVFGGINIANEIYENPDLCPGDYTMFATDIDFGCQIFEELTIGQPDTLIMSELTSAPTCNGSDGSISLGAMGGTPGYSFLWNDGDMNSMKENLGGGIYCATVTDDNGCQDSLCVTLVDGGSLQINPGIIQTISCPNSTDGKITVQILTGGNNFGIQWYDANMNPFSNEQIVCDVGPGTYYVQVEDLDQNCISDMQSIVLAPGLALSVTENLTSPSCPELSDGIVSLTVTGGSGNPTFAWENQTETGNTLFSVPAAEYCVTISDGPCAIDTCFNLLDPPSILVDIKSIDPIACFGETTGQVTVQASGGTIAANNFFYTIFDLDNNTVGAGSGDCITIPDLPAGDLLAFASDGQCPSEFIPFTINQPNRIEIDPNSMIIDPSCNGLCNGSAMIVAQGGVGPYTFFWPDYGSNNSDIDNLCVGLQYIEITDSQGCTVLDSFELTEPDTLIASIDPFLTTELNCNNGSSGMISIMHSGGNEGNFTYTWTDNVSDNTVASELGIGLYEITVTDSQGCTDSVSYELVAPPPVTAVVATPDTIQCFGGQTCIGISSASGGTGGNYTFAFFGSPNFPIDSCINVNAGEYEIYVFDEAGCSFDTTIFIDQPFELDVDLGDDFVEIDLGDSTAMLNAIISSFSPIADISWTPLENFECDDLDCQSIFVYPSTTTEYTVVVTDENGCTDSDQIVVRIDEERNVYFPNIFSPNNDGSNDIFRIYAGDGVESIDFFRIYDRWGNKLFEETELSPERAGSIGWDGTFKGKPLIPGVYVYVAQVTYLDNQVIKYSSDFTLFR